MTIDRKIRNSEVWIWLLVCLLAIFLVLVVLIRVARGNHRELREEPVAKVQIDSEPTSA